jgi:predicted Fe-Mo cluster-binding NifX family protein
MLQEHGIETLVAGEFGGKFITLLEESNINIVPGSGLVSEVIKEVLA